MRGIGAKPLKWNKSFWKIIITVMMSCYGTVNIKNMVNNLFIQFHDVVVRRMFQSRFFKLKVPFKMREINS